MLELALTRLIEIVGEVAVRIPDEERLKMPNIAWRSWVGLRNRLIHGYDRVDLEILWSIATSDLPPLIEELDQVLRS